MFLQVWSNCVQLQIFDEPHRPLTIYIWNGKYTLMKNIKNIVFLAILRVAPSDRTLCLAGLPSIVLGLLFRHGVFSTFFGSC